MHYIEAPGSLDRIVRPSVFLAGGITNCPDWQSQVLQDLETSDRLADKPFTCLNPRRKQFDCNDHRVAGQQIAWEWEGLRRADVIAFWFPTCHAHETVQPIALLKLGRWSGRTTGRPIVVGADPQYPRRFDITQQLMHERPELEVVTQRQQLTSMVEELLIQLTT